MNSKTGKVTAAFETVTPETAAAWLRDSNKMNRTIRVHRVDAYAQSMTDGEWDSHNGDAISFDTDGQLVNGQHRLSAITVSGVTLELLIVRGVAPESRTTIDDGAKRMFSDDLSMNGVTAANTKAGLLRKCLCWDTTGGLATWANIRFNRKYMALRWPLYADQIDDTEHATHRWTPRWHGNQGAMQFMYWLLIHRIRADKRTVERYFQILAIGSQDPADEVLIRCRDKLDSYITISPAGAKHYGPVIEEVYYMIRAWNAWLGGTKYAFSAPRGGFEDPYPTPILAIAGDAR